MEESIKAPLGVLLSTLSKKSFRTGEVKIISAVLKATLVDGQDGIDYSLYTFQVLTGMPKRDVDTNLGRLLKRKVLWLDKASNRVDFAKKTPIVSINTLNPLLTVDAVSAESGDIPAPRQENPVLKLTQGITRYMPNVKYDQRVFLIEQANAKRLYGKFYAWAQSEVEAIHMIREFLLYKLDTNEWFRTQCQLPFTMLYRETDQYLGAIKPLTRDEKATAKQLGRRMVWHAKERYWGLGPAPAQPGKRDQQ